jgi:hypothetical protein
MSPFNASGDNDFDDVYIETDPVKMKRRSSEGNSEIFILSCTYRETT